ncbi:uncharacterized protein [Ptychodera flava]|uniref:uncharacterized protein n=1 Tax=Ptychodera flava TaxID=63121 RepID=UPI00396A1611
MSKHFSPENATKYQYCLCERGFSFWDWITNIFWREEDENLTDDQSQSPFTSSGMRKRRLRKKRSIWHDGSGHSYIEYQGIVFHFSSDNSIEENREVQCCDDNPTEIGYSACSPDQVRELNRKFASHPKSRPYSLFSDDCRHYTTVLSGYLNDDCRISSEYNGVDLDQ